ncbi:hypothetical protein LTR84_001843 [Exophiala bonariae]|uniref:NADAR domain-containing protein n=1 Tax=Exophiala bonariae TaxID=1690606 RepID=A0AAV9NBN1_9EURO|nr:hypothetical protein LTR84_001843 [Exophiala bonariae]
MSTDPARTKKRLAIPRGPAADPAFPASNAAGNPYKYSAALLAASQLPPRVTPTHVFFCGYEGDHPLVCLSQWFPAVFSGPKTGVWLQEMEKRLGLGDEDESDVEARSEALKRPQAESEQVDFPTAEHFMMYHKALLMGDEATAAHILAPEHAHPSHAKRLGRAVRHFDQAKWNEWAERIVAEGNRWKFSDARNRDLRVELRETRRRVLVEASPEDRVWGVGFDVLAAEGREAEWGENRLGRVLQAVREDLGNGLAWVDGWEIEGEGRMDSVQFGSAID